MSDRMFTLGLFIYVLSACMVMLAFAALIFVEVYKSWKEKK